MSPPFPQKSGDSTSERPLPPARSAAQSSAPLSAGAQPPGTTYLDLADGTRARARPVVPEDAELLRSGLDQLSERSRRTRFLAPVSTLSDAQVRHLVEVDGVDHVAFVVFAPADEPTERPVAVGRIIRYPGDRSTADLAITVADEWQRRGVGTALSRLLYRHRPEGVEMIKTMVSSDNPAALALAHRMGVVQRASAGETAYEVRIRPARP